MGAKVWHYLTYGMYVCTAMDGERPVGCIVNTAMKVASKPALFAFSLNQENYTREVLQKSGRFALNILAESAPMELFGTFGFHSSRDVDKFESHPYTNVEGLPVLRDNLCGALIFELHQAIDLGTHTLVIAELKETAQGDSETPMSYFYYNEVLKGKVPKSAPSYAPPEETAQEPKAVCQVCGYVHDTLTEQLPADFRCPICGVDRTRFKDA